MMACTKLKSTISAEYCTLTSLEGNFTSSGKNTIDFLFMVIAPAGEPLTLQDVSGGNAVYVNPKSRDAVITSRQYHPMGDSFVASIKTCKAIFLDEQEFERLIKNSMADQKSGASP